MFVMSPLCVCICVCVCDPVTFYVILLSGHHGSSGGGGFNRPSSSSGNHRNRLVRILQYTVRVTTLLGVITAAATHPVINQYNYCTITIPYHHDTTGVGTTMTGKLIFYVKVASNHLVTFVIIQR